MRKKSPTSWHLSLRFEVIKSRSGAVSSLSEQFRSKLSFADELLTTRLKDSEHRTWSGLNTDLGKRSADRNKLAHWPEQHFPQAPAGKRVALVKHRLFSKGVQAPNMLRELNLLSKGHPPFDALCARDLNQMRLGFFALTVRIHRLRHKLLNLKQIFPVEAEKPIRRYPYRR